MKRAVRDEREDHKSFLIKLFILLEGKIIRFRLVSAAKGLIGIEKEHRGIGPALVSQIQGFIICDEFTEKREQESDPQYPEGIVGSLYLFESL